MSEGTYQRYKERVQSLYFWVEVFYRFKREARANRMTSAVLFLKILEFYEKYLRGRSGFIIDGRMVECPCGHEIRPKDILKNREKGSRQLQLSREIRRKFHALVKSRGDIKPRRGGTGASLGTLAQAAILTYIADIEGRPTVFCDVCLKPVEGVIFLYGDEDYRAPAYLFTPDANFPVVHIPYGRQRRIYSQRGFVVEVPVGSAVRRLLSTAKGQKLSSGLKKLGYDLDGLCGEGLVRLKDGRMLSSRPSYKLNIV